jgi:hypothetical protein
MSSLWRISLESCHWRDLDLDVSWLLEGVSNPYTTRFRLQQGLGIPPYTLLHSQGVKGICKSCKFLTTED